MCQKKTEKPIFYNEAFLKETIFKVKIDVNNLLKHLLATLIFSGTPTGLITAIKFFANIQIPFEYLIIFFTILFAIFFIYIQKITNQNKHITRSKYFHECIHNCRDETETILIKTKDSSPNSDSLAKLCLFLCEKTKDFFETIKRTDKNNHVGVAIRLADKEDSYSTKARAGLHSSRNKSSEPLSKNDGVAKCLLEKEASGCYVYKNVKETDEAYYKTTKNDEKYKDVISMMAVPINCNSEMIGILHISSNKKNFFSNDDVEYAKAFADLAAIIIFHKQFELEAKSKGRGKK